ncbi:MAG TPA: TauD/TfdA family dioxygenase [Candidatus Baltobacteraceae bacterium]|jgi:alpha-ketoglutarate-dependent 2,4-dichlorophenoxyacetate dioxygenase|nr:TauD/TfdA family dioxygenase [Candidatus Baltobacteraceae bacterium]
MEIVPLGPGFAAELRGIDLVDVASNDAAYHAVREAFEEYSVIVFREQMVSDDMQVAFTRAFGPLELTKAGTLGAGSFYTRVTNIGPDGTLVPTTHRQALVNRGNQLWHTDSSFKKTPALASVLSARIIPEHGGETQFTSTRLAWNRLPDAQKEELHDLIVVHSYANSRDQIDPSLLTPEERAALPPVRWRMTWQNPANGRDALYIASHAAEVEGMEMNEGKALLARMIEDATQTPTTYLHRWRVGDVVMWDNRATMHRACPWSGAQARLMVRTIVSASDADGLALVRPN